MLEKRVGKMPVVLSAFLVWACTVFFGSILFAIVTRLFEERHRELWDSATHIFLLSWAGWLYGTIFSALFMTGPLYVILFYLLAKTNLTKRVSAVILSLFGPLEFFGVYWIVQDGWSILDPFVICGGAAFAIPAALFTWIAVHISYVKPWTAMPDQRL